LSIEFLNDLENKIDTLIATLKRIREENVRLSQELEQSTGRIKDIETQNQNLQNELATLKADSAGHEQKLTATVERIQGLLMKLESV
jgi:FtsZ-binding cell division protein ZapB